ncbi:MAG: radical SAM protein [Planctomycetes bacterium]|nr:radical SAM protein [Planctomycetota bacterium]
MHVAIIAAPIPHVRHLWPASGAAAVAAGLLARPGLAGRLEVRLVTVSVATLFTDGLAAHLGGPPPDLLAFSCYAWSAPFFFDYIDALPAHGRPVVAVGGPATNRCEGAVLADHPNVDYVVSGAGEGPMATLVEAMMEARDPRRVAGVSNVWSRDDQGRCRSPAWAASARRPAGVSDGPDTADDYRAPMLSGLLEPRRFMTFTTLRGCAARCGYCNWWHSHVRAVPREAAVAELRWARDHPAVRGLFVTDYAVNALPGRVEEVVSIVEESGFAGELFLYLDHERLQQVDVEALRRVNVGRLGFGLQSLAADPSILQRRSPDLDVLKRAVDMASALRMPSVEIILGLPGDTLDTLGQLYALLNTIPVTVTAFHLWLLPGSALDHHRERLGLRVDRPFPVVLSTATINEQGLAAAARLFIDCVRRKDDWGDYRLPADLDGYPRPPWLRRREPATASPAVSAPRPAPAT